MSTENIGNIDTEATIEKGEKLAERLPEPVGYKLLLIHSESNFQKSVLSTPSPKNFSRGFGMVLTSKQIYMTPLVSPALAQIP